MIDVVSDFLLKKGIKKSKIHFERFTASKKQKQTEQTDEITSNVLVSLDGDDFEFQLSSDDQSILDAAMEAGADVPFSCEGAVCCTCKAKVKEGKVVMDANYSLSKEEVSEGYILTCQAHPITANIVVDYDEIQICILKNLYERHFQNSFSFLNYGLFYKEFYSFSENIGSATNNEAEYTALIKALELSLELNISQLTIFSDSELIVKQINLEYKVKNERLQKLHSSARTMLAEFVWTLQHVSREKNKKADALSKQALTKKVKE